MKQFLTNLVSNTQALRSITRKLHQLHVTATARDIEGQVRRLTSATVMGGPFKGLRYPVLASSAVHASTTPKLLGIYEKELHDDIDRLLSSHRYDRVIDIGAAEGYYVAGLGGRQPGVKIVAFEADEGSRNALRQVCDANQLLDAVDVRGYCSPEMLNSLGPATRTFLVCDCEGAEIDLITEHNLRALGPCDLIIECHDMFVPECCERLAERLSSTHDLRILTSHERTLSDVPHGMLEQIKARTDEVAYAIGEHRHYQMQWIVAEQRPD